MDIRRRAELEALLQREFARQIAEQNLDSKRRVAWLLDQLENYINRWLGMKATVTDDLFLMIQVGAAAVSQEIEKNGGAPNLDQAWRVFLGDLDAARQGVLGEPGMLAESALAVRGRLDC